MLALTGDLVIDVRSYGCRKNIAFGEKDIPKDDSKVASKPKSRTHRRQRRTKRGEWHNSR